MPKERVTRQTVYQFAELSERAKDKARDWMRTLESEDFDHEYVYEDAATIADLLGINLRTRTARLMGGGTRQEPQIYFSGFSSQGDGACFVGSYAYRKGSVKAIRQHAPQDKELHQIALDLQSIQRLHWYKLTADVSHTGHYSHSHSTTIRVDCEHCTTVCNTIHEADEAVSEALRSFMDWIYYRLRDEYEYRLSDEAIDETITANEYEFNEDGERI